MILSDGSLRTVLFTSRDVTVDPEPRDSQIQPCSIDVTLGNEFLVPRQDVSTVDVSAPPSDPLELFTRMTIARNGTVIIPGGGFILACTEQRVTVPSYLAVRLEGRSTVGRLGLLVHVTAGLVDPGFDGQITLELFNAAPWGLVLTPGMAIGQLVFERLTHPALRPYGHPELGSKYQGQTGPTAAKAAEHEA